MNGLYLLRLLLGMTGVLQARFGYVNSVLGVSRLTAHCVNGAASTR